MLLAIRKTDLTRMLVVSAVVIALLLPASSSPTAQAQIGSTLTIRSIALGPGPQPGTEALAIIGEAGDGTFQLFVKALSVSAGDVGSLPVNAMLNSQLQSDPTGDGYILMSPVFVLNTFDPVFGPDGSLRIIGPTTQGPFGDPAVHGGPTSFVVLPQPRDPTGPWIAIGTDTGNIVLAKSGIDPCWISVGGTVVDLAVVPQVGYFAFVALVNKRDGQHLVGINPAQDCHPASHIVFDVAGTTGLLFSTLLGGAPDENDLLPSEPAPVNVIATNGTRFIHRLTIPAEPTIGGTFRVRSLKAADSPIAQAAVGSSSLALLPVDGAGVVYDPGFRVDRGGVSGKLLTIFGSSLEVRPRRLSLQGRRRFVTVFIEVANDQAAHIDRASIGVSIGAADLGKSAINAQREPDDYDHDGNLEVEVNLDRSAVQSLIRAGATSVTITAHWRFSDGSRGSASAEISIKSQGDDDDEVEDSD